MTTLTIVRAAGGIFLAGVELAAPLLAATMLVEIAVSLLGKLSPQLPVMNLDRAAQDHHGISDSYRLSRAMATLY